MVPSVTARIGGGLPRLHRCSQSSASPLEATRAKLSLMYVPSGTNHGPALATSKLVAPIPVCPVNPVSRDRQVLLATASMFAEIELESMTGWTPRTLVLATIVRIGCGMVTSVPPRAIHARYRAARSSSDTPVQAAR